MLTGHTTFALQHLRALFRARTLLLVRSQPYLLGSFEYSVLPLHGIIYCRAHCNPNIGYLRNGVNWVLKISYKKAKITKHNVVNSDV